jgi:hypothetical protein
MWGGAAGRERPTIYSRVGRAREHGPNGVESSLLLLTGTAFKK